MVLHVSKKGWLPSSIHTQLSFHFMLGQSILYFKFWERKPCPSQCTNVLLLLRFWSPKTHGTCGTEWERDLLGLGGVAKGSGLRVLQGTYWHLPSLLKSVSSPESWVDSMAEQGRVCSWDTASEQVCLVGAHTLPRSGQRLCPWEEGWEKVSQSWEKQPGQACSFGAPRAFYLDSLKRGLINALAHLGLALNPPNRLECWLGSKRPFWKHDLQPIHAFSGVSLLMYDQTPFSVFKES